MTLKTKKAFEKDTFTAPPHKGAGSPLPPPVTYPNASAVILNLKELQSAVFYCHLNVAGLCIQTVTF